MVLSKGVRATSDPAEFYRPRAVLQSAAPKIFMAAMHPDEHESPKH